MPPPHFQRHHHHHHHPNIKPLTFLSLLILPLFLQLASGDDPVNFLGVGATFPSDIFQAWMSTYATVRSQFVDIRQKYRPQSSRTGRTIMLDSGVISSPGNGTNYGMSEFPYSDQEFRNNSGLAMFPVIAGALVLAYNIPELTSTLVLTMDHVVGIYNGTYTWWNDTAFRLQNPKSNFPNESIKPVVRYFPAGSTFLFTKCLSTYSRTWNRSYGTFWERTFWNDTVPFEYGQRSAGMGDTISSLPYSIGYVPAWIADGVNLRYASIVNRLGITVSPKSIKSLLNSMEFNKLSILSSKTFTSNIIESSQSNYPIIGYSYMIIRFSSNMVCPEVVNLARYILWITTSQQARDIASSFGMSSITNDIAVEIQNRIVDRLMCGKNSATDLVAMQLNDEEERMQTWKTPVAVSIPICLLVLAGLVGAGFYQRRKYIKMIDKNDWKINGFEIEFNLGKRSYKESNLQINNNNDDNDNNYVSENDISDNSTIAISSLKGKSSTNFSKLQSGKHITGSQLKKQPGTPPQRSTHIFGKYNDVKMCFSPMWLEGHFDTNFKVRQVLNRMRGFIEQENVSRFYGLTWMNERLYIAEEYCEKGFLIDLLKRTKYNLDKNFRFSVSKDLLQGLTYLHHNDIIHGFLTTDSCVVNSRWTVKIKGWGYNLIYETSQTSSGNNKFTKDIITIYKEQLKDSEKNQLDFWLPPEALKNNGENYQPAKSSDLFNFGLILFKIFTTTQSRNITQHENNTLNQTDVSVVVGPIQVPRLAKIQLSTPLPAKVKFIVEQACMEDPIGRPSFEKLTFMLKAAHASKKDNIMDNIIETIEKYGNEMERKVTDLGVRLRNCFDEKDKLLSRTMPHWAMMQVRLGKQLESKLHKSLTVLAIKILFPISPSTTSANSNNERNYIPSEHYEKCLEECLQEFQRGINEIIDENGWLFKVDQTSNSVLLIAGLNGMSLYQNIGRMVQISFNYREFYGKKFVDICSRFSPSYTFQISDESCPSFLRLGTTLHAGPIFFSFDYDRNDSTTCKFMAYSDAVATVTSINDHFATNITVNRITVTDVIFKNLPVSQKNIRARPIANKPTDDLNLYWLENETLRKPTTTIATTPYTTITINSITTTTTTTNTLVVSTTIIATNTATTTTSTTTAVNNNNNNSYNKNNNMPAVN